MIQDPALSLDPALAPLNLDPVVAPVKTAEEIRAEEEAKENFGRCYCCNNTPELDQWPMETMTMLHVKPCSQGAQLSSQTKSLNSAKNKFDQAINGLRTCYENKMSICNNDNYYKNEPFKLYDF